MAHNGGGDDLIRVRYTHPDTGKLTERWMEPDVFDLWYERSPDAIKRTCEAVVIPDEA